jgi:hypothetical protein
MIVMTHRGTTKGMQDSEEVTESHRNLLVFQKWDGRGQVVANRATATPNNAIRQAPTSRARVPWDLPARFIQQRPDFDLGPFAR